MTDTPTTPTTEAGLSKHVFARIKGKLARWDLEQPLPPSEAIAAVVEADNPPRPVLALVLGAPLAAPQPEDQIKESA